MAHTKVGTFTLAATVAAYDVEVGFTPSYVELVDYSNGSIARWWKGLGDGLAAIHDMTATTATDMYLTVTGGAITPKGDESATETAATYKGFQVGAATAFNVASAVIRYVAVLED